MGRTLPSLIVTCLYSQLLESQSYLSQRRHHSRTFSCDVAWGWLIPTIPERTSIPNGMSLNADETCVSTGAIHANKTATSTVQRLWIKGSGGLFWLDWGYWLDSCWRQDPYFLKKRLHFECTYIRIYCAGISKKKYISTSVWCLNNHNSFAQKQHDALMHKTCHKTTCNYLDTFPFLCVKRSRYCDRTHAYTQTQHMCLRDMNR